MCECRSEVLFNHETGVISLSSIREPQWRATHVLKPDLELLQQSIIDYGLLSPLIIQKKSFTVIDGYHRWVAVRSHKKLASHYKDSVQALIFDIDDIDAMLLHLRLNRGRGNIFASNMSTIIKDIVFSGKYSENEIGELLNMNVIELDMMLDGSLLKSRKVKDHTYSKAWVPIEVPAQKEEKPVLERPPNADR